MVRRLTGALAHATLACPICAVPEGTQMTDGIRAGALVLIVVTAAVVASMAAYGIRLWRTERDGP